MSRNRFKLYRSTIVISCDDVVAAAGATLISPFSTSVAGAEVTVTPADLFSIVGSSLVLSNSSVAGSFDATLTARNPTTGQQATETVRFTVTGSSALTATAFTVSALDGYTIQYAYTADAAYASYQATTNNKLEIVPVPANKRITVATPNSEYDCFLRGVTAGGEYGPWNTVPQTLTMPPDPGLIGSPTTADQAESFVQSIATNVHLNYNTPADSNWLPVHSEGWLAPLRTAGYRSARTGFLAGATSQSLTYMNDLYAACGMKFILLVNPRSDTADLTGAGTSVGSVVATTANVTLSGIQTIDGVAGVADGIVVVKNQTAPAQNGVYVMKAGAWTRHASFDTWTELYDKALYVNLGTVNGLKYYGTTIPNTGTLGTTAVTWGLFSGVCSYNVTSMQNMVNTARDFIGAAKILAFEGPNEVNNHSKYHWAERTVAFQQTFYNYVRGIAAFAAIPIIGPSIWGRSTNAIDAVLAAGGWANFCDVVPAHVYTGGRKPTVGGTPLDSGDETGGTTEVSLVFTLNDHRRMAPGKPIWMTEWGQNAQSSLNPGYVATPGITSEIAQSKYTSRAVFEHYINGVAHTSLYAWLNNWTTDFHGHRNNNKPVSQKPVGSTAPEFTGTATAGTFTFPQKSVGLTMERILATMADAGVAFTPSAFTYSFTGAGATGELHHKLFQKRNGKFFLLCCLDGVSWKRSAPVGDLNPSAAVTLNLGIIATNIKTWTPHASGTATDLGSGSTKAITVPDSLMIIEITP